MHQCVEQFPAFFGRDSPASFLLFESRYANNTMTNEFKDFVEFIRQTTGRHPEFAESFNDLFIYVPSGKIPPDAEERESNSPRTVSIEKYMNNRNRDFVECVYHADWNQLEHHLGPQLLRFCLTECILAKRTETGAFMVSKLINLQTKIAPFECPKITIPYCRTAEEHLSVAKENDAVPDVKHLMCPTDLEITTDHMLRRNSKSQKFPQSHTLMRKSNGPPMSSQVINLRVGVWPVVGYQDCIQPLELILDKLRKSHKSYAYKSALDRLIISENIKSDGKHNFGDHIPVPVLKKYFGDIMRLVVPNELFGSHRNRNAVTKSICDVLDAPRGQAIGLGTYISRMKISDIPWLEGVKNTDSQWCLIAKLVKWLYNEFILQLFSTQLYITVTDSNKKVYFKHTDWQKRATQFWRKMKSEEVIARSDAFLTRLCCEGRWILFPKKTGVRPIMSPIGARRESTKTALCYLQQLHMTKYGASGNHIFLEKWRNLVENSRNDNKIIYLVCCDIQNAYESIDQKKLFEIVESLAASTGPELCRKWYKVGRNLQAVKSESTKLKRYFAYPELELPIAPKSIFACASDKVDKISKEAVLREIRRNILNQNLLISSQRYVLQKGIAQGAMLSSVLCDIYYSDMEEKNLSEFRDQGFLYRYVDDFLFVTGDKDLAERFLQRVNAGFPEYNCYFNAAKTRSNLLPTKDSITFLGFNIDPHTFEITPDFPKSPRYTTLLSKPRYDIPKTFFRRLANLATLKLDGLILDCKINSRETIMHNMECVFKRQAERCLWLLQALFDDIPRQLKSIFWTIKSTNLRIIRRMQRYFLANGYSFEELIPSLWTISWSSYRQVFGKKQHIHAHFRNLFLHYMKINKGPIAM